MKLVILDRDGTINEDSDAYIKSPDEWVPIPGSLEAIARLNHAGWHTVIATNQSGLARGLFDMATLNAIHARMNQALASHGGRIDAVFFCPHAPGDGCACRKPLPLLFTTIGERYGLDLAHVHAVGDTVGDLRAGAAAGCKLHLVRTGKSAGLDEAAALARCAPLTNVTVHADLAGFARMLVQSERRERGDDDESDTVFRKLD